MLILLSQYASWIKYNNMFSCHIKWTIWVAMLLMASASFAQEKDTAQRVTAGRRNSVAQQAKPYVILISADGFRYDYARQYQATNLLRLSRRGIRAQSMIPSFPSLTFPNHYTLVTGLYPAHHGMVNNVFYDRQRSEIYVRSKKAIAEDPYYYGGEPLWVLAEQQELLSACFYWVGSDVAIQGTRPTYYYPYNEDIPLEDRLKTVKQWLQMPEATRPHLITFYLPQVDKAGHEFGPDSKETIQAIGTIDHVVGQLCAMVDSLQLPVNYIFLSDHGMTLVDTAHTLTAPVVDTAKAVTIPGDILVNYYAKDTAFIPALYSRLKAAATGYDVYLRNQSPQGWHYGRQDDHYNRIGDVFLVAHHPKIFTWGGKKINPGRHGYDPRRVKAMEATFMAWGPAFKKGKQIKSFENIHVYALIARLLGLTINQPVDSRAEVLQSIIR